MNDYWVLIRDYCLSFPEVYEDFPWGDTVFKVGKKIFTFTSGPADSVTVTVKVPEAIQSTWKEQSCTFFPSYVGRYGWVGIRVTDAESFEMARNGIELSYRRYAGRRRGELSRNLE